MCLYKVTHLLAPNIKQEMLVKHVCTLPKLFTIGLTYDVPTWLSLGIIYSSRTIYRISWKLLRQRILELSVDEGVGDWLKYCPTCAKQYATPTSKVVEGINMTYFVSKWFMKSAYLILPSSSNGNLSTNASNWSSWRWKLNLLSMAARNSSWLITFVPSLSILLQCKTYTYSVDFFFEFIESLK